MLTGRAVDDVAASAAGGNGGFGVRGIMKTLSMAVALAAAATACLQPAADAAPLSAASVAFVAPVSGAGALVTFDGPGYSVLVPQGWSRTEDGSIVSFSSGAGVESIQILSADVTEDLRERYHPVGVITMKRYAALGNAPASMFSFHSQSNPDPVTGKTVELRNALYTSSRDGLRATLLLSAAADTDNADTWAKIAASFRWR